MALPESIETNPNQSSLDQQQIMRKVFDEGTDRLRTDSTFSGDITGDFNLELNAADDSVALGDGTNTVTTTQEAGKTGLDVNILNDIATQPSGLRTGLKSSVQTITDTATPVPLMALMGRNTISIRINGTSTVYFGGDDVTSTNGYPKFQFEDFIADVTDAVGVNIWAVCAPGESCEVRILEIA